MHRQIDWTDLQFVLTLARAGTLKSAGRALGVSHTTVLRRIAALEASQGVRLFDRLPSGYSLTAGGEEMLAAAQAVADMVRELELRLAGRDLRLEGILRITTMDSLMASLLPPILATFQAMHPGVRLEVTTSAILANLSQRDADVAIRVTSAPPDHLVGRRIASVAQAIYQSARDVRLDRSLEDLKSEPWVGPSDELDSTNIARWMKANISRDNVVMRADSLMTMAQLAAAGTGLVALPCYLGDVSPGLRRAGADPVTLNPSGDLWVLTHPDLRNTARIRTFTAHVGEELAAIARRINGEGSE